MDKNDFVLSMKRFCRLHALFFFGGCLFLLFICIREIDEAIKEV